MRASLAQKYICQYLRLPASTPLVEAEHKLIQFPSYKMLFMSAVWLGLPFNLIIGVSEASIASLLNQHITLWLLSGFPQAKITAEHYRILLTLMGLWSKPPHIKRVRGGYDLWSVMALLLYA